MARLKRALFGQVLSYQKPKEHKRKIVLGLVPHEMIFYPAAYPIVNQHVQWQIVDPYGTQRERREPRETVC
jgi:hypothetical protein